MMTETAQTEMTENEQLAYQVIASAVKIGVKEFCFCPGARNSSFFTILMKEFGVKCYFSFEERSAAFFALGKSKCSQFPTAVITTSGTAAGELLPAAMEAYYTGIPLLLLTADRPRRFRGTGAPQAAEQVGLFGCYAPYARDIAAGEVCDLEEWSQRAPAHLNVCFEDPFSSVPPLRGLNSCLLNPGFACPSGAVLQPGLICNSPPGYSPELFTHNVATASTASFTKASFSKEAAQLDRFLFEVKHPMVVVGGLPAGAQPGVAKFLQRLNAPVFLEGISGLREDPALSHLRITRTDGLWKSAELVDYRIDGILRIGGVPTFRLWRDLEDKQGEVEVCSLNEHPFSGLSWGNILHVSLSDFFEAYDPSRSFETKVSHAWLAADQRYRSRVLQLLREEPQAEASLIHALSQRIPSKSRIYLGNSLPIREWDLAADDADRGFHLAANRGLNGIDGQISTFLGWCTPENHNWAILGDLTTLYDFAGLWVLPQMPEMRVTLVVINNGGGKIFSRLLPQREFINAHQLTFEPFAKMWGMHYERWTSIPEEFHAAQQQLIEVVPDDDASERLQKRIGALL